MLILILSIVVLGIFAALFTKISNRGKDNDGEEHIKTAQTCATCDGTAASKCEQECMMEASVKPIEYFDDEELDAFRDRPSDKYDDNEVEQFADVLYTMRQDEVAAWCRSLHLRGINLPDQIKDEVIAMIDNN